MSPANFDSTQSIPEEAFHGSSAKFTVHFSADMTEFLRNWAIAEHRTVAQVLRICVRSAMDERKKAIENP